jgi:formamidopyrimidine-DNA glycosylase
MPELPEVEQVRRSLAAHITGQRIVRVELRRSDVVDFGSRKPHAAKAMRAALLEGQLIGAIERHGKQLAVFSDDEASPALCIHLGMTGSMTHHTLPLAPGLKKHTHVVWHLDNGHLISFHDPRRFGGVWCFPNRAALVASRWSRLGDDALSIEPSTLHARLRRTTRGLKATLLDQTVVAGLGNIYVDELLFACGLHPRRKANRLKREAVERLVLAMRDLLARAIASGGSTLRNYVDADGQAGGFQFEHRVYGRGGHECCQCQTPLQSQQIAGRTTVYCPTCQRR